MIPGSLVTVDFDDVIVNIASTHIPVKPDEYPKHMGAYTTYYFPITSRAFRLGETLLPTQEKLR